MSSTPTTAASTATPGPHVRLLDSTLRDGSHGIRHRYTPEQVELIAGKLDEAGMHSIGVGHGDGLGASSIQYMRSLHTDDELLSAARRAITRARLAVTFQPGIGTKRQLERAAELGADLVRIATHCTEADTTARHLAYARERGKNAYGNLMMCHMASPIRDLLTRGSFADSVSGQASSAMFQ
jgi:4-hydroxy 2-oxovalerate aldolase